MKFHQLQCFKLFILMYRALLLLLLFLVIISMLFSLMITQGSHGFFFLNKKSDLFAVFKHFKNLVENQYSTKIKVLRFDNGGEYLSFQFQSFCSDHGILHQTSCPYVPQQNGISERKHRH